MATKTPAQVYADLRAAGASDSAARILTEIAGAESGFNDSANGDVGLESTTWGPSFGLFQIRTLKGATGSGTARDISALAGDDQAQAAAALAISKDGTDFSPWTTYTNGAYQQFKTRVNAAIASITGAPADPGSASTSSSTSPALFGLPTVGSTLDGVRDIAITGLVAVLGIGLLGLGVAHFAAPAVAKVRETGDKVTHAAADAAVLAA